MIYFLYIKSLESGAKKVSYNKHASFDREQFQ